MPHLPYASVVGSLMYAMCRNLSFGGRAMRESREHLPRGENARSATNVYLRKMLAKPKSGSTNFKSKRFGSCFYARGRY